MRVVKAESASPIDLGRWDEKNVTRVEFDLAPYIKTYGEGVPQLTVKKPGDPLEYAAPVEREGNTAVWIVGREWLTKDGQGWCQLSWHVTDGVAKSPTYKLKVSVAMGVSDETAKEPQAGYLAQVQAAGVEATRSAAEAKKCAAETAATVERFDGAVADTLNTIREAKEDAEGCASHPPIIGENGNWWEWDGTAYADSGKPSRGDVGPKGEPGEDATTRIVGEVVDGTLCLYAESGALIHVEVKDDILCIG